MPVFGKTEGQEYTASANTKLIWARFTYKWKEEEIPHGLGRKPRRVRVIAVDYQNSLFSQRYVFPFSGTPVAASEIIPSVYATRIKTTESKYTGTVDFRHNSAGTFNAANMVDGNVSTVGLDVFSNDEEILADVNWPVTYDFELSKIRMHLTQGTASGIIYFFVAQYAFGISGTPSTLSLSGNFFQGLGGIGVGPLYSDGWQEISFRFVGCFPWVVAKCVVSAGTGPAINEIEFYQAPITQGKDLFDAMGHTATNLYLAATAPCRVLLEVV
jgi:hypothetical protein